MKIKYLLNPIICMVILAFGLMLKTGVGFAQEGLPGDSKKEEVKKLEEKIDETKETIKKKEENVIKVKEEAVKVIEEKEVLEKKAQQKEHEAIIVKEELEAVKEEAERTHDPEVLEKAKVLSFEAEKLKREADQHKKNLKMAESKVNLAQQKIQESQAQVESLRKSVEYYRKEVSSKRSLFEKAIMGGVTIFIGLIFFFIIKIGVAKFEKAITKKDVIVQSETVLRMKTISKLFRWMGNIIIVCVVLYMVLENFGFRVAPLLAGAGIVGLAFGFGGQYLIRDIINGFFILVEGQYFINDVVKIGEHGGLVEDINLRFTRLRDLEGRVIFIPNGEIKTVVNFTKDYAQSLFDIGVAYKENVDQVMDVIKVMGKEIREDSYFGKLILGDLEMLGVDDFGDSQVTIKFRMKTLPIKQWEVSREFKRRLKNRFDELGIEIPFPHRTLYWGEGKENAWMKEFAKKVK